MNVSSLRGVLALLISVSMMMAAVTFAQSRGQTASTPPAATLPDVVGLRTGISAQEAYDFLKARGPKTSIGIGQIPVAGVSDKPVPVSMSVRNTDLDPVETITLWLTTPPSKQVVFAVGRSVEYEENKQLLKSTVRAGLLQKYGPELDDQSLYWAFDEQGKRIDGANQISANCKGRVGYSLNIQTPEGATYAYFTPLLYTPGPATICDTAVDVRATLTESGNSHDYVTRVTVLVSNRALARRSQEAYQALLSNNAAAKQKEELEKAKQQKGPTF